MRLRYTLPALTDLTSILDYIADRSPQGLRASIVEFAQSLI
jgi:plasmid stabilization system protein ParE